MKALLLKPINDVYYVIQPNLGLGYLATIMEECGHKVRILHSGKERLAWKAFTEHIKDEQYDLIGIQMFINEITSVKRHIDIIKRYSPTSTIVVGGPQISGDPSVTMNVLDAVDFGFVGESEIGMEHFMRLPKRDYTNPQALKEIPGLVWRQNGRNIINPRQIVDNLDALKFPAWHLMPPSSYPNVPHKIFTRRASVAPIVISRGCPFECTFCAAKSVTGRRIRYRSIENVVREIAILVKSYGVGEIHIEDDNFTLRKKYVIDFCNEIKRIGLDVLFALPNGVRLDKLDEEILQAMEQAGFYSLSVGIESGNDRVLQLMKKGLSIEIVRKKVNLIKQCTKMELAANFLIGYPGETESEILETIAFLKSLPIDKVSFNFVTPLPGSELWLQYKHDKRDIAVYRNFFSYRYTWNLSSIPADRLMMLYRKALWEFYARPKVIFGLLKGVKTFDQLRALLKRFVDIFPLAKRSTA